MTLGELGAILLALTVLVVLGNLWFYLVEGLDKAPFYPSQRASGMASP